MASQVSLNPKHRYTTQSSKYDALLLGKPLSDRRISHYIKQGWYGRQAQQRAMERERAKERARRRHVFDLSQYENL